MFFFGKINAQPLNELLQIAATKNPELKSLEKEYSASLERAPQVGQLPNTEFGAGVFPLPVETRLGAQIIKVGGTQMLPWPGTLKGMSELETIKSKVKYEQIAVRQIAIFYEIKKEWLQLYKIENSQFILQRNIQLLNALERLALANVESGKASATDVLKVQLKTNELKQKIAVMEVDKIHPTSAINQLLNRELNTEISIGDSLDFAPLVVDKNDLNDRITAFHPMLKMLGWQEETAKKSKILNDLKSKPMFGVGLDYILVNGRSDSEPAQNGRDIVMVRGSVKIPLNKKKFDARENEENLKMEAIEWQKKNVVSKFKMLIEKTVADHETAKLKLDLYNQQIELTAAAINMLESEFSATGRRFNELLELEMELIEFDLKRVEAIVESHLAKASLERFVFER
ncbi:MAG: TolC family protein [Bacteroidota bacterium]